MSEQQAPAAQHLSDVIGVLNAQAYVGHDEPSYLWDLNVNPWVWRITAATADAYPDAQSAQAAANALVDALVAASQARLHENGGQVRQGAAREVPLGGDTPVYRGVVEVLLHA